MNGNLLLNERPLLIIPSLAASIGLNESIILQQLHYWLERSKNIRLDRKWVYFTYDQLREQFPFFSKSTIRRLISKLEKEGFLSSDYFNKMKMDHTKWYTINYDNLHDLTNDNIPSHTGSDASNKIEHTNGTNQTDEILNMNSPDDQHEQLDGSFVTDEVLTLNSAIPETSTENTTEITSETSSSSSKGLQQDEEDPFRFFEQNGFGTIGGFLADKIKAWCMDLSDVLVIEAMKLAVENSSKRWNYVEAILMDWVDKGYQTIEEVHAARLAYKETKQHAPFKKPRRQELLPDWLHNQSTPQETVINSSFEEKKKLFDERMKKMNEKQDV